MNARRTITLIFRLLLAGVFIFSGFVKAVDPWGTAIKMQEYASALGFGNLGDGAFMLSVLLSGGELTLGLATLFGVKRRLVGCLTFLFMTGFTVLTLWSALTHPVADCGCFGDALPLTPWQSFWKNVVLWILSLIVWLVRPVRGRSRRGGRSYDTVNPAEIYIRSIGGYPVQGERSQRSRRSLAEWGALVLFFALSCGIGVYAFCTLPLIDFLPFKVGTNIPEAMGGAADGEVKTTLVYRDRADGTLHEFALSDTTWYDDKRWEYVDTRIERAGGAAEPAIREFAIFDAEEDMTDRILHDPGRVYLLCVTDPAAIPPACSGALGRISEKARAADAAVYAVTPAPLGGLARLDNGLIPAPIPLPASVVTPTQAETAIPSDTTVLPGDPVPPAGPAVLLFGDAEPVPVYNIDGTTLKTMLRARNGLVILQGGTILEKKNCRSLR